MTTRGQYRLVEGPILKHITGQDGQHYTLHDLIVAPNIRYARRIPVPPPAVPCMAYSGNDQCGQPSTVGLLRVGHISALYLCDTCYRLMR